MNRGKSIINDLFHLLVKPLTKCSSFIILLFWFFVIPGIIIFLINYPDLKRVLFADVCQALALSYVFGWLYMGLNRRLRIITTGAVAIISYIISVTIIVSGRAFSTVTLLLIAQTDMREAESFSHQFVTPLKIVCILLLLITYGVLFYCFRHDTYKSFFTGKKVRRGIIFCVMSAAIVIGMLRLVEFSAMFRYPDLYGFEEWYSKPSRLSKDITHLDEYRNGDLATSLMFALRGFHLNTKEIPKWELVQQEVMDSHIAKSTLADSINVVMIIGESFIKNHSNIYGYPLKTNPRLTAELDSGRLVAFDNYITSANFTAESLRNALNMNDLSEGEAWSESAYLPLIMSKGGWNVHLYDNQFTEPTGIADVQLGAMMRNALMDRECYEWTNDSIDVYDGEFIDRINRRYPFDDSTGNFDIFHLYGQHFAPVDRYPDTKDNNYFTKDSIPYDREWFTERKKQTVAEYDNATRYNDKVIGNILDRYGNTPSVILYFSDHGEEMYDTSDCEVRNEPSGDVEGWLRRQFEIPFFVWSSDAYRELFPEKWQAIKDAASRPGMLDNVGQLILGLGGMQKSGYYRSERDIASPAYRPQPRITSGRHINYDSIVGNDK